MRKPVSRPSKAEIAEVRDALKAMFGGAQPPVPPDAIQVSASSHLTGGPLKRRGCMSRRPCSPQISGPTGLGSPATPSASFTARVRRVEGQGWTGHPPYDQTYPPGPGRARRPA